MGRRKKEPKSVHREKIATAASALFMEKGIAATSMDDIAKAAGYSKATLYVYFENKEEIVGILVLNSMKKLYDYKEVVIDAQYFSKRDIQTLHKKGVKVNTYLNVGSIENFRKYYKDYEHLAIGDYENWDEEKWIDVSSLEWQKFIKGLSGKLLKKGVDGFFIDNCDVYCYAKTKKNFVGLVKILRNIKSLKKEVIINGGDVFVKNIKVNTEL